MKRSAIIITILVIVSAAVLTICLLKNKTQDAVNVPSFPVETTITGRQTCLPHKKTNGPITLECAFGIETPEGDYYALDTSLIDSDVMSEIVNKETIEVSGLMVPIEAISSNHWEKYDIEGIIQVSTIKY